ncbi:hypothetical protein BSKO_09160 [Bryopsis sp. KO-2023]|nr:hypothetical protein BSKO_09160 [Bryopsis sp. KO-2023]
MLFERLSRSSCVQEDTIAASSPQVRELDSMLETLTGIDERKDELVKYEGLFDMATADFFSLEQTQKELMVHHQKWKFLNDFRQSVEGWMKGACSSLNVDEFDKNNHKMVKSRWDDVVVLKLKEEIEAFRETMSLLREVANEMNLQPEESFILKVINRRLLTLPNGAVQQEDQEKDVGTGEDDVGGLEDEVEEETPLTEFEAWMNRQERKKKKMFTREPPMQKYILGEGFNKGDGNDFHSNVGKNSTAARDK